MTLFLKAIRGEWCSRPPVWMMRQAGRYLPEYQEVRKTADFLTMVRTPELACEISLQPIRRFPLDACVFFSDILTPLVPMGIDLRFEEGEGPKLEPAIRTPEAVRQLQTFSVEKELSFVPETLKRLRQKLPEEVALIGFAGAPFTLAAYLIEGTSSKQFIELHRFLYRYPDSFQYLMDQLSVMLIEYLHVQIQAGAQALQLFDTWGGVLSLEEYRRYALPALQKIFAALKPSGVPLILYLHHAHHLLPIYQESGAEVASIDWRISLTEARSFLDENIGLQGNLNPLLLFGSIEEIERQTHAILHSMQHQEGFRRFIFNLGHGILPKTPIESVSAMLNVITGKI